MSSRRSINNKARDIFVLHRTQVSAVGRESIKCTCTTRGQSEESLHTIRRWIKLDDDDDDDAK